jgi:hypothetical protein
MTAQLESPRNECDILTDGFITQAGIDAAHMAVSKVEFNPSPSGYEAVFYSGKNVQVLPTTTVASIDAQNQWTWRDAPAFSFLPQGGIPATDELVSIARTLHGNGPSCLVPTATGFDVAIVQADAVPTPDLRTALCVGMAQFPTDWDLRRALLAFSAATGFSIHATEDAITFTDGTVVDLASRRITSSLSFADVVADAFYFSTEHQLLFEGRFPNPHLFFDQRSNTVLINNVIRAYGIVAGTISNGQWHWAHHDTVRRFATDYGLLEFFHPAIPAAEADAMGVAHVLKPLFKHWTHAFISLDPYTTALVLLDAPQLHLPPANPQAAEAVLSTPVPHEVDPQRAKASYHQLRY